MSHYCETPLDCGCGGKVIDPVRWVCPPCRRGEHADTYHLVGVDVGDRAVCACEVCDA